MKLTKMIIIVMLLCGASFTANATLFTETTDAGGTLGTAVALPAGTNIVQGTMGLSDFVDLFSFVLDSAASVTFDLSIPGGDAGLNLFNGAGMGLAGDDDGGPGLDSSITIALSAGTFFIATGTNGLSAFDVGNSEIVDDDSGVLGAGALSYFGDDTTSASEFGNGGYTLTFSVETGGAAVPEPTTIALLSIGLAGIGYKRHRSKKTA